MVIENTKAYTFEYGQIGSREATQTGAAFYDGGAALLKNMIVLPSGAAMRRPGTKQITNDLIAADEYYRLFRFLGSPGSNYLITIQKAVSTNGLIRIFNSGVTVATISGTSNLILKSISHTEWATARVDQLQDRLIISIKDKGMYQLIRVSDASWNFERLDIKDGPYQNLNQNLEVKVRPQTQDTTGVIEIKTVVDSGGYSPTVISGLLTTDLVGRDFRVRSGYNQDTVSANHWGAGRIISIGNKQTLTIDLANQIVSGTIASGDDIVVFVKDRVLVEGVDYSLSNFGGSSFTINFDVENGETAYISFVADSGTTDTFQISVFEEFPIGLRDHAPSGSGSNHAIRSRYWQFGSVGGNLGFPRAFAFDSGRMWIEVGDGRIAGSVSNAFDKFSPTLPDLFTENSLIEGVDGTTAAHLQTDYCNRFNFVQQGR